MHIIELQIDSAELAGFARRCGLPTAAERFDRGYAVHAWMAESMASCALRPFRVQGEGQRLLVLGYSAHDAAALERAIGLSASPSGAACLVPGSLRSKRMPMNFTIGANLGFEVRVTPTRRMDGAGETCAYELARRRGRELTREQAYVEWLQHRLGPAAEVQAATMTHYERAAVTRRAGGADSAAPRATHTLRHSLATLAGRITVLDAQLFAKRLAEGVGRGKAFGFGMLLLRA